MRLISRKTLLLFFLPGAVFMGAFLIYPIITMVIDSFYEIGITGSKRFIGPDNYIRAFTAGGFLKQLMNTLIYITVAVGVETVAGLLFALFFELDYRGSKIIRSFMMAPLMIAPLVAGLTWKLMMSSSFGIVNELLTRVGILESPSGILWLADEKWSLLACCIADIWLTTPFMMLMILAGLQGLDTSMLEAARIDGAGLLQQVFSIKLPVIKPVLLTALSVRIIDAARTFDIIWAMTEGGPNRSSETISIIIYKTLTRYNDTGYASAMAVVFIAVLVLFTLVFMQSLWNPKNRTGRRQEAMMVIKKGEIWKSLGIGLSVILTVCWLFPYIYVICCSFKPGAEVIAVPPSFFPKVFSVESFLNLLERMDALKYLLNSLSVSLASTIIALLLGSLAAYAIQRSGAKLSVILVVLVLCLKMIPTSSIVVPIYELICNLGLYDTRIALVIVYAAINMPFVMWTMLSFYEGIPTTLDEAAFVDGASSLQTFRKVILPICRPGLATAFIFTLFLAWNDFLIALLLTSTNAKTFTVGLAGFLSAYNLDLGPMCAGAFLFSFPVMVISLAAQKYIVQGMTAGAVKG